ncbi:MAG: polyhydroxyalkanoate synthesis repressor PhaR [Acuticoccus sp.]
MANEPATIVIKKYANRRLYNTRTSAYVTLEDLADMVRKGQDFVVHDAKSGEDITRGVLGQIIFDAESRGGGLLPIAFLRQLITLYGGHMQSLVPAYLEYSLASFAREQETFSRQMNQAIGKQAINAVEDQVRRNMDMFERSVRMFIPYGSGGKPAPNGAEPPAAMPAGDDDDKGAHLAQDVAALRSELAAMQARIEALSGAPDPAPHSGSTAADTGDENDPDKR